MKRVPTNAVLPPALDGVQCPRCAFGAGIYVAPKEHRTVLTPVRCVACSHEALLSEWLSVSPALAAARPPATRLSPTR